VELERRPLTSDPQLEDLLRAAAPRVLGAVVRRFGDFAACEDAVQEALLAAATQWPAEGTPQEPVAWLIAVASRRMTDRHRSEAARAEREELSAHEPSPGPVADHDDTLALMFMCCHPSLTPASAIALTLRAVGGLTTREIATAFLVPEATMAQRVTRAKQTVKASNAPFAMPGGDEWGPRLRQVLHVLYLIFNEGYVTTSGPQLARADLALEAIRLARIVHAALPGEPEVAGLLALMLLTEARRPARADASGALIPLAEQDRTTWDAGLIAEGDALIEAAWHRGAVGEYQVQAAIAAVHDAAPRHEDTDWPEIVVLYGLLGRMTDNPMVALNAAIARAMVEGPQAGLARLGELDEPLAGHHRLHAARAHLLEMAGDDDAAIAEFTIAAERTTSTPERNYLTTQAARLNANR